jgi:hypothetical protein
MAKMEAEKSAAGKSPNIDGGDESSPGDKPEAQPNN